MGREAPRYPSQGPDVLHVCYWVLTEIEGKGRIVSSISVRWILTAYIAYVIN